MHDSPRRAAAVLRARLEAEGPAVLLDQLVAETHATRVLVMLQRPATEDRLEATDRLAAVHAELGEIRDLLARAHAEVPATIPVPRAAR